VQHPGNILVSSKIKFAKPSFSSTSFDGAIAATDRSGSLVGADIDKSLFKIVLVDAGMVARLLPDEQFNFIGFLEAMGQGDGKDAANRVMMWSSDAHKFYSEKQKVAFRADMDALFKRICRGYGHNVSIGEVLRGVLTLVRIHKITVEANYATLVMNALCLDGMAQNLMPSYNILDGAKPLLKFNRLCKRLPGGRKVANMCLKAALPFAQWAKMRKDEHFLKKLLAQTPTVSGK